MSFTINNQDPKDFAISDLRLHFASLDDDWCDITFPLSYDAAIRDAFQEGKTIVIRDGSDILFSGICPAPVRRASASSQSISLRIYGPFHDLRRETFYQLRTSMDNLDYYDPVFSVEGSAKSTIENLLDESSCGTHGTVNTLGSIPPITFSNTTRAAALQTILRFFPAARSHVTYGITQVGNGNYAPLNYFNILNAGTPVALSPASHRIASLVFTPANQTPDGLRYDVLRRHVTKSCALGLPSADGGNFTGTPIVLSDGWRVVSGVGGDPVSKKAYIGLGRYDGAVTTTNYTIRCNLWRNGFPPETAYSNQVISSNPTWCANYGNANELYAYNALIFCAQFGDLGGASASFQQFSGTGTTAAQNIAGLAKYVTKTTTQHTSGHWPILLKPYSAGTFGEGAGISQMDYVGLKTWDNPFDFEPISALAMTWFRIQYTFTGVGFSSSPLNVIAAGYEAGRDSATVSVVDDTSVAPYAPDYALLAALRATTPSISATIFLVPGTSLPVRPSDYAVTLPSVSSVPCPLQTLDLDLLRHTLSLTAGSPRQLSADDYISIHNLS